MQSPQPPDCRGPETGRPDPATAFRPPTQPATRSIGWRRLPLAVILGGALLGWLLWGDRIGFELLRDHRAALLAYRDAHLGLMAAGFFLAYVLIVTFSLPGAAVASVTGGFLFGLGPGTALNVAAATAGAVTVFWALRLGLGRALERRIAPAGEADMGAEAGADMGADMGAEMGQMQRWRARLHENEVSVLLILRLVPVVPFFAVNLLAALAGVRFGHFLWTTALGILPGALVFTSVGVGLGDVLDQGAEPDLAILWQPQVLAPLLGLAALAALPMLWRAWRRRKGERAG